MGNFIAAVVFYQIIPLTPLWFEWEHTGDIKMDSFILTVSIYSFAIGFSSKYIGQLAVCFLTGLLLAGAYKGNFFLFTLPFYVSLTTYFFFFFFFFHFGERFKINYFLFDIFFKLN